MVWIYGAILIISVIYLLFSIFAGGLDADMDFEVDANADIAEVRGLGCSVIAAFLAGFGSMGVLGSLSGWNMAFTLLTGVAFGLIFGRTTLAVLRFVVSQQSNDLLKGESLIGAQARITVDIPAGKVGEALVQSDSVIKYPVKATSDDVILWKGDYVEVVAVENGRIYVKKKRIQD